MQLVTLDSEYRFLYLLKLYQGSLRSQKQYIDEIKKHARVFISAENKIPKIFKKYQLSINPTEIHDMLSFADLFIGEGATMASECAIMGTPSIYINTLSAGTLEDQQQRGILYMFKSSNGLIEKTKEILTNPKVKKETTHKSVTFRIVVIFHTREQK